MAALVWILLLCYLIPWVHTRKFCVTPPPIANGQLRYAGPYYVPDEAVYDCNPGFTVSGTGAARCVGYNSTHGHFTANGFPPLCVPPYLENTSVQNNYINGMPEWLSILLGVFATLVLLILLTCAGLAIWYLCCRYTGGVPGGGASNGWGNSRVSSNNQTNTYMNRVYNTSTNSNSNQRTTPPKTSVQKQDAGTQVQIRESGNYGTNVNQRKPNTTITKVYMEETRGTTTGSKPLPPWMPHSQPIRKNVYNSKSIAK